MNTKEFEIVVHTQYGGFSLTLGIVTRLRKAGCPWIDKIEEHGNHWYVENSDSIELRCDPMLVAVIKELTLEFKEKSKGLGWTAKNDLQREMLGGLVVQTGSLVIEIEDYHDGKERVVISGSCY